MNEDPEKQSAGNDTAAEKIKPSPTPSKNALRFADIALGVGAAAAGSLDRIVRGVDQTVRNAVVNAPELLDEFEERGKPVRQRLTGILSQFPVVGPTVSAVNRAPNRTIDDIASLEARVRELEAQQPSVVATGTTDAEGRWSADSDSTIELEARDCADRIDYPETMLSEATPKATEEPSLPSPDGNA